MGERGRARTRRAATTAAGCLLLWGASGARAEAQVAYGPAEPLAARIWFDRGAEPLLDLGERVRIYYRTSADAWLAIFHIDTNGTTSLVFPRSPDEDHYVRGGRDYRLLFPRSQYWIVDDHPGVGYYFAVASPEPFDFSRFRFSHYDSGWDLSLVGRQVYRDPYVAMDEYVAALIPDWDVVPYALDFATYDVGDRYEYPRFLCYDCHGFRPYTAWNPYYAACTSVRVVIYDDPYFYPARRYRADRVVWARPPEAERPRFAFKERARGETARPVVRSRSAPEPTAVRTAVPRRGQVGSPALVPDRTGGAVPRAGGARPDTREAPVDLGTFRGPIRRRGGQVATPSEAPAERDAERPGAGASRLAPPRTRARDERPASGPPPRVEQERPVLRKRPSDPAPPQAGPGGAAVGRSRDERPPTVRPPARSARPRSEPARPATPPERPSSGSSSPRRPPPSAAPERRSGGSAAPARRPSPEPAPSSSGRRPTVRSEGRRPVVRPGG